MNKVIPLVAVGMVLLARAAVGAESPQPAFRPQRVVPPRPPIVHPPAIPASRVADQVVDEELVLGVVIDGHARAYPINMLTGPSREIVNDTLGERRIAATW